MWQILCATVISQKIEYLNETENLIKMKYANIYMLRYKEGPK